MGTVQFPLAFFTRVGMMAFYLHLFGQSYVTRAGRGRVLTDDDAMHLCPPGRSIFKSYTIINILFSKLKSRNVHLNIYFYQI